MFQIAMIPDITRLEESKRIADKYHAAFEYNDFFMPDVYSDETEVERRIELYRSLGRDTSKDILHGVFLDIVIHSADRHIAEYSEMRTRQSMEIADKLGLQGVVFHTGLIAGFKDSAYVAGWLDKNEYFYRQLCGKYPNINVYMENMFDLDCEMIAELAKRMKDVKNFGICLDYAHAQISSQTGNEWLKACGPYLRHMHINDNNLKQDQHKVLGTGKIDWENWAEEMAGMQFPDDFSVLIEVSGLERFEESLKYLEKLYEEKHEG